ncbi:hypothetical protein GGR56DRAFT_653815 [Xylariaceae sp. FL0804]|nr:hypothetical protein GGR56DRAFT_653815 [Xylariaceae sp. FL0804]
MSHPSPKWSVTDVCCGLGLSIMGIATVLEYQIGTKVLWKIEIAALVAGLAVFAVLSVVINRSIWWSRDALVWAIGLWIQGVVAVWDYIEGTKQVWKYQIAALVLSLVFVAVICVAPWARHRYLSSYTQDRCRLPDDDEESEESEERRLSSPSLLSRISGGHETTVGAV